MGSSSVQSLSHVQPFVTLWTAAHQPSLSITNSRSLLKLMSIESVMPYTHLILCRPQNLPPSIFPSSRVFSNKSSFCNRCQSIEVSASASVLSVNIQDWFPSGLTGWISWKWERTVYLDLSNFKGHASSSPSYLHSLIHSFNQYIFIECLLCPRDCLGHWINEWWMK